MRWKKRKSLKNSSKKIKIKLKVKTKFKLFRHDLWRHFLFMPFLIFFLYLLSFFFFSFLSGQSRCNICKKNLTNKQWNKTLFCFPVWNGRAELRTSKIPYFSPQVFVQGIFTDSISNFMVLISEFVFFISAKIQFQQKSQWGLCDIFDFQVVVLFSCFLWKNFGVVQIRRCKHFFMPTFDSVILDSKSKKKCFIYGVFFFIAA